MSVKWKMEEGVFKMDIKIPVGSTARVTIPKGVNNYKLNGKSYKNEVSFMEAESGENKFSCKLNL